MNPADILALALGCGIAIYAGWRTLSWIADRVIGTVEYLTRFEER